MKYKKCTEVNKRIRLKKAGREKKENCDDEFAETREKGGKIKSKGSEREN